MMPETAQTRAELANGIRTLQGKGDTAGVSKLVAAYKTKYQSQPQQTTGSAGQALIPGSTPMQNIKAIPGQLLSAGKALFGHEVAAGQDVAAAIGGNAAASQAGKLQAADTNYLTTVLQMRKTAQASGQDTSHWDNLIRNYKPIDANATLQDIYPALGKTNEQVAGDFAGVAADIISAGGLESGAKAAATPTAGFLQGAIQGAKVGAKAGILPGAAQGLASGLAANKSAGGVTGDVALGAGTGAATGAIAGGIIGGVTANPKAPKTPQEQLQDSLKVTQPTLSKKESITALERSGAPGGATVQGKMGTMSVVPSPSDIRTAASVQDVVSPKANPIENIVNVNQKIEHTAENEVRPVLQANPSPFNLKTLNAYIRDNTAVPNYIKADPVLQKTYDLTRDSMLEEAAKNPKTLEGLWDSRISFDHVAERQVGTLNPSDVKVSVIKQAVLDTRRAVNDYIAENLPNGTADFTQKMQLMNHMYQARSNIAEANYKLLNSNLISRWIKLNPQKAHALEIGAGLTGLGLLGNWVKGAIVP